MNALPISADRPAGDQTAGWVLTTCAAFLIAIVLVTVVILHPLTSARTDLRRVITESVPAEQQLDDLRGTVSELETYFGSRLSTTVPGARPSSVDLVQGIRLVQAQATQAAALEGLLRHIGARAHGRRPRQRHPALRERFGSAHTDRDRACRSGDDTSPVGGGGRLGSLGSLGSLDDREVAPHVSLHERDGRGSHRGREPPPPRPNTLPLRCRRRLAARARNRLGLRFTRPPARATAPTSGALDACPQLKHRSSGACSAACIPVSMAGRTIGVVHAVGADGTLPTEQELATLNFSSRRGTERISMLRAFDTSLAHTRIDPRTGLINQIGLLHRVRELRLFARLLRDAVRPNDIVAAGGGDDFLVVLPDCSTDVAVGILERAREQLALSLAAGTVPGFTVTFGVASTRYAAAFDDIVGFADTALGDGSAEGADRVVVAAFTDPQRQPVEHS